jgi:hypothetical protein
VGREDGSRKKGRDFFFLWRGAFCAMGICYSLFYYEMKRFPRGRRALSDQVVDLVLCAVLTSCCQQSSNVVMAVFQIIPVVIIT